MMHLTTFPVLETERLILRRVVSEDLPVVLQGYNDERVYKYMSVQYHGLTDVMEQLEWYDQLWSEKSGIWWGMCEKETGQMIGNGGFHKYEKLHQSAELGYWLLPEYQGRGYAMEAVQAMMEFGFNKMELHRIEAIVESENTSSSALLSKLGFELEGVRRECEFSRGKYIDLKIWAILEKLKG